MWKRYSCGEDVSTGREPIREYTVQSRNKEGQIIKEMDARQVSHVLEENVEYREDVVFDCCEANMQ